MSSTALTHLTSPLRTLLAKYLPTTPVGYSFLFLLAWNAYGLPLVWHFRALAPYFWFLLTGRLAIKLGLRKWENGEVGKAPLDREWTKMLRSWPSECDMFGFHLSNSSYAKSCDELRGNCVFSLLPAYAVLPGGGLALGGKLTRRGRGRGGWRRLTSLSFSFAATSYQFIRQIDFCQPYKLTTHFAGHDRKWIYMLHTFSTTAKDGTTITNAKALSTVVLKIGRRTVAPNRALAMSGYGPHGEKNWAIFKKLSDKQRTKFLVGELSAEELGVTVGEVEIGLERRQEWPGAQPVNN